MTPEPTTSGSRGRLGAVIGGGFDPSAGAAPGGLDFPQAGSSAKCTPTTKAIIHRLLGLHIRIAPLPSSGTTRAPCHHDSI